MKRIFAILFAASILLHATACGMMMEDTTPPDSETNHTDATEEIISIADAWAAQKIDVPDLSGSSNVKTAGDRLLLCGYNSEYTHQIAVLYDATDGMQKSPFHCLEQSSEEYLNEVQTVLPTDDGYVVVYRKRMREDGFFSTEQFLAETYDKNWQYQSETDISSCLTEEREMSTLAMTEDGYCFIEAAWGGADLRFTDRDWNRTGKLAGSVNDTAELFTGADGKLYLCTEKEVQCINTQSMSAEKCNIDGLSSTELKGAFAGQGETAFYVYDREGVYAVSANMTAEKILDWSNSGFVGDYILDVQILSDGSLCMSCYGESEGIWRLSSRSQEELDSMETITVASVMQNSSLTETLSDYSRGHTIKFEIKDYSSYYDESAAGHEMDKCIEAFERDLLSGIVPDMICTQNLPYRKYINKGLFEDLYDWMERDETFQQEDYLTNFFASMEDDGHLYRFSSSFSIYTVAGKSEFVGDKEGLTIGEYNALAASIPADMQFLKWPSNWSVFSDLCMGSLDFFVDRHQATCYFDSPEMVDMLTFCNTFPSDRSIYDDGNASTWEDGTAVFRNNEVCLYTYGIHSPTDFHIMLSEYFGSPVTLIGYPTPDGKTNGAKFRSDEQLAMYSGSEHKEAIWDYFKYQLSEEAQTSYNFPVNRNALQKKMDDAVNAEEYPATREEMDRLMTYIGNVRNTTEYDVTISGICTEESEMYFAGDQTAEKAIKNMQSRVSIYLAEQS